MALTVTFTAGAEGDSPVTSATLTLTDATDPAKTAGFELDAAEYASGETVIEVADIEGTDIGALVEGQVLTMVMTATSEAGTSPASEPVEADPFGDEPGGGAPEAPTVTAGTWA